MNNPGLERTRAAIEKYNNETADELHQYFELFDGTAYEGSIVEIREDRILFEWAVGPFTEDLYQEPIEIPIDLIDIGTFR